ncbi:hypothetical protein [Acinetobacter baumannii]|nr:hypothetical protein [Acinetobacter baumannii]
MNNVAQTNDESVKAEMMQPIQIQMKQKQKMNQVILKIIYRRKAKN